MVKYRDLRHLFDQFGLDAVEHDRIVPFSLLSRPRLEGVVRMLKVVNAGKVQGDTAEIGCNNGGTSRLIALLNQKRHHWAVDTFEGLVDVGEVDRPVLTNGHFRVEYESTVKRLADQPHVTVIKGYFPDCAPQMANLKYAFVHIDTDTYKSMITCLRFFEQRMSKGGIMLIDDAIGRGTPGGTKAWEEMLASPRAFWHVVEYNNPAVGLRFA